MTCKPVLPAGPPASRAACSLPLPMEVGPDPALGCISPQDWQSRAVQHAAEKRRVDWHRANHFVHAA